MDMDYRCENCGKKFEEHPQQCNGCTAPCTIYRRPEVEKILDILHEIRDLLLITNSHK